MNEATLGFLTSEEPRTCDLLACRQHEGRPTENPALKAGTRHYTEKCSVREPFFCVLNLDLKKNFRLCQAVDEPPPRGGRSECGLPCPLPLRDSFLTDTRPRKADAHRGRVKGGAQSAREARSTDADVFGRTGTHQHVHPRDYQA